MTLRTLFSVFALGATLSASAMAAESKSSNACFTGHRIGPVAAYRRPEPAAHGYDEVLAGARVFVYAKPGLTAEWLNYSLTQSRASVDPSSSCPIDVPGTRISVQSGGPGFWVTLSSDNAARARQILERAQRLVQR